MRRSEGILSVVIAPIVGILCLLSIRIMRNAIVLRPDEIGREMSSMTCIIQVIRNLTVEKVGIIVRRIEVLHIWRHDREVE